MKKLLIFIVLCTVSIGAVAQPMIVAGQPLRDGNDEFLVTLKNGTRKLITVAVKGTDKPEDKAFRIQVAMQLQGVDARLDGNKLTLRNATKVEQTQNKSGEAAKITALSSAIEAIVGYHGTLAGVDDSGFESIFQASFGFDGLLVDADLMFSMLSGTTIDALLMDVFNEFSADLAGTQLLPNLKLNLANQSITFIFPIGEFNYFVQNFTSDIATEATVGLSVIPEPSTLTLLGIGCTGLIGYVRLRRRAGSGKQPFGLTKVCSGAA